MIASVFLHEVATVLTDIIIQRKSKPNIRNSTKGDRELTTQRTGGVGEGEVQSLFFLQISNLNIKCRLSSFKGSLSKKCVQRSKVVNKHSDFHFFSYSY